MMNDFTIYGLVTPREWKFNGEPLKLKICTNGEIDYLVEDNELGQALFPYIRQWVYARGSIHQSPEGNYITIKEFSEQKIGGLI